jgi:N-succinyldiaminopimelate aminotransferase
VSAARYVEDVDRDPVVLIDGLTKNWRYPGWRVSWTVGPKSVIDAVASAGSFLDGGGSRPCSAPPSPCSRSSTPRPRRPPSKRPSAKKRTKLVDGLQASSASWFDLAPEGTFYVLGLGRRASAPPAIRR